MARSKPATTAAVATGLPTAESTDIARMVAELDGMLIRLRLGAIQG